MTFPKDEWGEWMDHSGIRQTVSDGILVLTEERDGDIDYGFASEFAWDHVTHEGKPWCGDIIRYRIRKPRALLDLIELVENLPERVDA